MKKITYNPEDIQAIHESAKLLPAMHKKFVTNEGKTIFYTIDHEKIMLRLYRLSGKEVVNLYFRQVKKDYAKQKRRG